MRDFENPIDAAVGIIPLRHSGSIKLAGIIRGKATDDGFGKAALVGGYVNKGESIEEAIAREAQEEIGFKSSPEAWNLLYSRHVSGKNINLIFCLHREILEVDILTNAVLNEEVAGFVRIEKTTPLAFPLHEEAVRLYYNQYQRLHQDTFRSR